MQIYRIRGIPTRRVLLPSYSEKSSKKQKTEIDWNQFIRREERDNEDEESDETHIIASSSCNKNKRKSI